MQTITPQQIQDILDQEIKLVDCFNETYIDGKEDAIARIMALVDPLNELMVDVGKLAGSEILTQVGKAALLDLRCDVSKL